MGKPIPSLALALLVLLALVASSAEGQEEPNRKHERVNEIYQKYVREMEEASAFDQQEIQMEEHTANTRQQRVLQNQPDLMDYAWAIAQGLDIESQYNNSLQCVSMTQQLTSRIQVNYHDLLEQPDIQRWFEIASTMGNVSTWFKFCISNTQNSLVGLYDYVLRFQSLPNYLLYLLPNLLSYAFFAQQWILRMEELDQQGDVLGLAYYYSMIIRRIFFFDVPEDDYDLLSSYQSTDQSPPLFLNAAQNIADEIDNALNHINAGLKIASKIINSGTQEQREMLILIDKANGFTQYVEFFYFVMYKFLVVFLGLGPLTFTQTCNANIQGIIDQVQLAQSFSEFPTSSVLKEQTFAYVTILEYLHPISVFCYQAGDEIEHEFSTYSVIQEKPHQVAINIMKKLGSILFNLMTVSDCVQVLDGQCVGKKLGTAGQFLFDYSDM